MSDKTRVALIFGGRSAEHEVSLVSARAVLKNLDPRMFETVLIYIAREGRWKLLKEFGPDENGLEAGGTSSFLPWEAAGPTPLFEADIYFPLLHGPFGEDGTIQGLLEMAGVPFVGSGVEASALGMDKAMSKAVWRAAGLPVVPFAVVREEEWRADPEGLRRSLLVGFSPPLFVKPARLGSSIGITKVMDASGFDAAVANAFRYDSKVLVEKAVEGREIECSLLGNETPEASVLGEVIPCREFYDYADKYLEGKTRFVVPAELPREAAEAIRRTAVEAFRLLECSGFARADFFYDRSGRFFINEVNTIPGFTEISMFPRLWQASGIPFPALVERLVALGFERHRRRKVCLKRDVL